MTGHQSRSRVQHEISRTTNDQDRPPPVGANRYRRADQAALIHDSACTGEVRTFTYAALRDEVARFAGVLASLGVARRRSASRAVTAS